MIKIIAVRFEDGDEHQHIISYKWVNTVDNKGGVTTKNDMIDFVNNYPGKVFVEDNKGFIEVIIVDDDPPYLRTKADDRYTDNLLYLPTF